VRRFYRHVGVAGEAGGFAVLLDGKPVRTPKGLPLLLPTLALAEAVAGEWLDQGETIRPLGMPLLRLANTGIDLMAEQAERSRRALLAYVDTDLICYFADRPAELLARQRAAWQPVLDWANRRYDIALATTHGVNPLRQPAAVGAALERSLAAQSGMPLLALQEATVLAGSLLLALAACQGALSAGDAWAAATVDERFQAETWGEDPEQASRLRDRQREFADALRLLVLLRG